MSNIQNNTHTHILLFTILHKINCSCALLQNQHLIVYFYKKVHFDTFYQTRCVHYINTCFVWIFVMNPWQNQKIWRRWIWKCEIVVSKSHFANKISLKHFTKHLVCNGRSIYLSWRSEINTRRNNNICWRWL